MAKRKSNSKSLESDLAKWRDPKNHPRDWLLAGFRLGRAVQECREDGLKGQQITDRTGIRSDELTDVQRLYEVLKPEDVTTLSKDGTGALRKSAVIQILRLKGPRGSVFPLMKEAKLEEYSLAEVREITARRLAAKAAGVRLSEASELVSPLRATKQLLAALQKYDDAAKPVRDGRLRKSVGLLSQGDGERVSSLLGELQSKLIALRAQLKKDHQDLDNIKELANAKIGDD